MTLPAVVMAAGLGTRLRPLTDRWAKAVLPLAGRPVVGRLVRELAAAGCPRATIVVGHLGEQVEALLGDGAAFDLELRYVRQPSPDGSADAVRRAGEEPPYLVAAADTAFAPGDVARFATAFLEAGAAGAVAVTRAEGPPVAVADGRVRAVVDLAAPPDLTVAPLWGIGPAVAAELASLPGPPYELRVAFQRAIDAGNPVIAVTIAPTRALTTAFDVLEGSFAYLRELR
jgi:NDP-sugar pyrophosphorylase family protein